MTRTILGLLASVLASFSVIAAEPIRLSEPVVADASSETFGQVLNEQVPKVELHSLFEQPEQWADKTVRIQTAITKVCQKKGCFFIAQSGAEVIRIAFKDYGFFIPTDSSGKTVWLTGQLVKKVRDQAQAEHFNQDLADASAKLAVGEVYEIIADSVKIPT
jgi:hypothetical protein